MAFKTSTGLLEARVANGATFQAPYPTGSVQGDFFGYASAELVINQSELSLVDGDFSISLGVSTITVTNLTGTAFPLGSTYILQLSEPEAKTGELGDEIATGAQNIRLKEGRFKEPGFSLFGTIEGAGINATIIEITDAQLLLLASAGSGLANLTVRRVASGSANAVLSTNTTTLANFLDGIELRNVRVCNTGGTAVGNFSGRTKGCTIDDCATGIYQNYGGIHDNLFVNATQYAVRYSQSAAASSASHPFASIRPAIFNNPHLVQTDATGGHVIQGLVESATMNQVTTAGINWFATRINGGKLHAACVVSAGTAATSEAVRGCVHLFGCGVDGDRLTTYWFDSYTNAVYWSAQHNGATEIMTNAENVTITGGAFVCLTPTKTFTFLSNATLNGVSFEQDPTVMIGTEQSKLINCTNAQYGMIGWQRKDLALLVSSTDALCETEITTDYNLATATVEAWIKLKSTSEDSGIIASVATTGSRTGFFLYATRSSNTLQGGFHTGATGAADTLVYSNAANTLFSGNTGLYADGWHHVAITQASGGTQRLWIDGVEKDTATAATPSAVARRLILGGFSDDPNANTSMTHLNGMIRSVRISSSERYATGTAYTTDALRPRKRFALDSNTVGLWSWDTTSALAWEDKTGKHDSVLVGSSPPVWVRQDYTP